MNGSNGHNGNGHATGNHTNGGYNGFEVSPDFTVIEPPEPKIAPPEPKTWKFDVFPTATYWAKRDIPPRDNLMGEWLSTTSRLLLAGPSGIGKSNFLLALALDQAEGKNFLHWKCARAARVLYIEGEMGRRLTKRYTKDALRRAGLDGCDNLIILSRDDHPDMPPLNTPEGQAFIKQFLEHIGKVDVIIFDNIQSLLGGNMKETDQWAGVLDWNREFTALGIGVVWIHHTNDDGSIYGDKTRGWQMEGVILLEKLDPEPEGIAFTFKYAKPHRERIPGPGGNAHEFEPVEIGLDGDEWYSEKGGGRGKSKRPRQRELPCKPLTRRSTRAAAAGVCPARQYRSA